MDINDNVPPVAPTTNSTYAEVLSKGNPVNANKNPTTMQPLNGNVSDESENETVMNSTTESDASYVTSNSHCSGDSLSNTSTLCDSDVSTSSIVVTKIKEVPESNNLESESSESESSDCSTSGEESDQDDSNVEIEMPFPPSLKQKLRPPGPISELPDTVTLLETESGSRVYLVGTAHFSLESQEDVSKTIRAVQPDIVMIELCKSRMNILNIDEATILEEAKNMNFQKMKSMIEQNGLLQGLLHILLLSMSAHLTKQLGMAPGGEFRRAFKEAKNVPGCLVHLGDRSIHNTLKRALGTLSWWQKLRIAWFMLRSKDPISKEDVERCKQKDLLEQMLADMTGEFPELSQVFVKERDIYLTYSLQLAAERTSNCPENVPTYVVGVVGIGHVPGIKSHWGSVTEEDVRQIVSIPQPTLTSRITHKVLRLTFYGITLYGLYRCVPKSLKPAGLLQVVTSPFRH